MLYEIDVFGFTWGYITKNWSVMSENDLKYDKKLQKEFEKTQYEIWKRHNIIELRQEYVNKDSKESFDVFCKNSYNRLKMTKV